MHRPDRIPPCIRVDNFGPPVAIEIPVKKRLPIETTLYVTLPDLSIEEEDAADTWQRLPATRG